MIAVYRLDAVVSVARWRSGKRGWRQHNVCNSSGALMVLERVVLEECRRTRRVGDRLV